MRIYNIWLVQWLITKLIIIIIIGNELEERTLSVEFMKEHVKRQKIIIE